MDRDDAKEKFKEADLLFHDRQYARALEILTELDRQYPNQRSILFPMARCLAGLRRLSEAMDLAERIARDFDYAPAKELRARLEDKHARISSLPPHSTSSFDPPADNADAPIETPKPAKAAIREPKSSTEQKAATDPVPPAVSKSPMSVAIAVCVGLVLLSYGVYAGIAATVAKPAVVYTIDLAEKLSDTNATTDAPWQEIMFLWVGFVIHLYALACLPMYMALRFAGALRFNRFGEDMKDAATFTLYGFLLAPLIVVGWAVFFMLLRRHFEITAGQTLRAIGVFCAMFAVVYLIDWAILAYTLHPVLAG